MAPLGVSKASHGEGFAWHLCSLTNQRCPIRSQHQCNQAISHPSPPQEPVPGEETRNVSPSKTCPTQQVHQGTVCQQLGLWQLLRIPTRSETQSSKILGGVRTCRYCESDFTSALSLGLRAPWLLLWPSILQPSQEKDGEKQVHELLQSTTDRSVFDSKLQAFGGISPSSTRRKKCSC